MAQGDDAGLLGWVGAEMIITDPGLACFVAVLAAPFVKPRKMKVP